jgi:hypothetical protein
MEDMNDSGCDFVPDKMQVDLNMFRALMLNQIGREIDNTYVVAVYECVLLNGLVKSWSN